MPRRKRFYSKRSRKSSSASAALTGYITLFILGIALVQILLPFIVLGAAVWGIFKLWQYWKQHQEKTQLAAKEQHDQLTAAFYQLIQQHSGRVSVFDLTMTAKVSAEEAKSFLDIKAKEFMAEFEPTDSGTILYVFNSLLAQPQTQPVFQDQPAPFIAATSATPTPQLDRKLALNQADLARRLDLSPNTVSRKKLSSDFAEWSQERDPEGWAWSYDEVTKRFHPLRQAIRKTEG